MNLKKLICIAAVVCFGSNAFAMEIYKGKVISQKVWSNDGSKAAVVAKRNPHARHDTDNSYEDVVSSISSWSTNVNEALKINNTNYIALKNNSDQTKRYYIVESVCSQTSDNFNRCLYYHAQIELEPTGAANINETPFLEMVYSKPGHYRVNSTSTVYDRNDDYGSVAHSSIANAMIFVS